MAEVRECAQCGTPFTPMREHAQFCSARCRMAWNREHAGVAAAPAVAIDWSVTAMTEAVGRFAAAGTWELPRLAGSPARGETEETLAGLRYVRNELGRAVDPADFVHSVVADGGTSAWTWRELPEPELADLAPRARQWELGRYRAYQTRLAGRGIEPAFTRCTQFLAHAAGLTGTGSVLPSAGANQPAG